MSALPRARDTHKAQTKKTRTDWRTKWRTKFLATTFDGGTVVVYFLGESGRPKQSQGVDVELTAAAHCT